MEFEVAAAQAVVEVHGEFEHFGRIDTPCDFGQLRRRKIGKADAETVQLDFESESDFPEVVVRVT